MTDSKRKNRKLSRAEKIAHFGEVAVREEDRINEQIQEIARIRKIYSGEIEKLPTKFQTARRHRELYKGMLSSAPDDLKEMYADFKSGIETLEPYQMPFPILIFESTRLRNSRDGRTKKLSFLRQTKRNLRIALKDQSKIVKIDFEPYGWIDPDGKASPPFTNIVARRSLPYGMASTSQIYRNPLIQSFFEFSLQYSYTKHIELTFSKARKIFIKACRISVNTPTKQTAEIEAFKDFLSFLYEGKGFFNNSNLPTYEVGRPPIPTPDTKRVIELKRNGLSNPEISKELEPVWTRSDPRRTAHIAKIGRTLRRNGLYARDKKKTTKN